MKRASGQQPVTPNVAGQPVQVQPPSLETSSCQGSKRAPSPHSNSMAVKDETGLWATACSAERCFLHLQETSSCLFALATAFSCLLALAPSLLALAARCRPTSPSSAAKPRNVQLPRLEKSAFATLKQHGSEGWNGPLGNSLYCRTLLSAPTRNYVVAVFLLLPPLSPAFLLLLPALLALAARCRPTSPSSAVKPRNVQLPLLEKSAFATLKQHGSERRSGPPGKGL